MKLLYAGDMFPSELTLKRLVLVADEIGFMDRPSVKLGMGGTVGAESPARRILNTADNPVSIAVFKPPQGVESGLYADSLRTDLANPEFVRSFFEGLERSDVFAAKVLHAQGRYSAMRAAEGQQYLGCDVRAALIADARLRQPPPESALDWYHAYDLGTDAGRLETTKMLLSMASIAVSSALLVAEREGIAPVTDDPYFSRLLAMRTVRPLTNGSSAMAPFLGIELTKAVIPDEVLEQLDFRALIDYRKEAVNAYRAWAIDTNRAAAQIANVSIEDAAAEVQRIVATELGPNVVEYRHAMETARDKLFGDFMKRAASPAHFSALAVAFVTHGIAGLLAALAASAVPIIAPPLVDYRNARRAAGRHAVSYLIGAAKKAS